VVINITSRMKYGSDYCSRPQLVAFLHRRRDVPNDARHLVYVLIINHPY
jgi:hypothetical protein